MILIQDTHILFRGTCYTLIFYSVEPNIRSQAYSLMTILKLLKSDIGAQYD